MEQALQKYFNISKFPEYVREEFEAISNSFNPYPRECLDGKFIPEFYSFNEDRNKKMKSKAEKSRNISKLISMSIKYLAEGNQQKVRETLIEAVENSKNLSFGIENDNKIACQKAENMLREMSRDKKKFLVKFKRTVSFSASWDEDISKREHLNLNPIAELSGQRCSHGQSCAWNRLWKLLSNDELPIEFCKDMAKLSCSRNSIE